MLRLIAVKDFAIIDQAELGLGSGLTALTGETGAGKSLLVDALMLLGGGRGDAGWVRQGAERAELAAEFDLARLPDAAAWLRELELDDGDECRVRRVLRADGSSRAFVNDRAVSLATLKSLVAQLVEIHGQNEHQALLSRAHQRRLLDAFGGHAPALEATATSARRWHQLAAGSEALRAQAGGGAGALEYLRFQLDELARDALAPEALAELEGEHRRLANAGELIEVSARAQEALDGDDETAARTVLARVAGDLERMAQADSRLSPVAAMVRGAAVEAGEAAEMLARYRAGQELDPQRLAAVDAQLARLHELARKHRIPVPELKAREEALRAQFDAIANAEQRFAALDAEQARALAAFREAAASLGEARRRAAGQLAREVGAALGELGMAGARFSVAVESEALAEPAPDGVDQVEFMVSANPGQPERPLRKVASGGELSRISLAIEVAALGQDAVPTMVFDEVDAGIGGAVAEVVGRKLRTLGRARQVLCVTHLPQVAAQADGHVAVSKSSAGESTRIQIEPLDKEHRREEIARMLGGVEITSQTRAHAADMLRRAQSG